MLSRTAKVATKLLPGIALVLIISTVLILPLGAGAAPVEEGVNCRFVLGFKSLHDLVPDVVGECGENEHYNPANGDALQRTTSGLLVWRKSDNFTAFTDGYRTWVNGPFGIQKRLNTERFTWERSEAGDDKGGLRPSGVSDDPADHDLNDDHGGARPDGVSDDPPGDDSGSSRRERG